MYVVVDNQWRVSTFDAADERHLSVLVDHPRTALQHVRAVLDDIARDVSEDAVLLSLRWLKSACVEADRKSGAQSFASHMERLHRLGVDEEYAGYIRVPIHWNQAARINRDCLDRQRSAVSRYDIYVVDTGERFSCRKSQPVLHAALASGTAAIRSGCHGGGCGICKIRVLAGEFASGSMSRAHVEPESVERHDVLACQIYPLSDLVIELLGKSKERVNRIIN